MILASYHNQSILHLLVFIRPDALPIVHPFADRKMDMIKNIPVHMDYVGQGRAEKLYQVLQIISDRQYFVTSHLCVSDHHCSVWSSGPWLGLHHPAVLSDGEDAAVQVSFNIICNF